MTKDRLIQAENTKNTRIIKGKAQLPRKNANTLNRESLRQREDELDSARLVTLQAPAGFGKTTAMLQLAEADARMGNLVAWLTLDDGDNDVSRFLRGFTLAISNAHTNSEAPEENGTQNAELADWLIGSIEQAEQPTSVYFDNAEVIRNPVVIQLIARGTHALPPGSRTIIATRRNIELGQARLRARGELIEFSADDLRFSEAETSAFLQELRHIALSDHQLQTLYRSTEGWAAALWLASVAMRGKKNYNKLIDGFTGSNAAVASYLAEDVLANLDGNIREFLLQISILDDIDPVLCQAVTLLDNSEDLLAELQRQNLFLQLVDEKQQTYNFHALFRDFLRNQLTKHYPNKLPELHGRAAQSYLEANRPIPAIRHLIKSGQTDAAVDLLSQHFASLLNDGRLRLLLGFLGSLPTSALKAHPNLNLAKAWCTAFTRGPLEALKNIDDLDESQLQGDALSNLLALRPMLLGMTDNIDRAHELGLKARDEIPENHTFAKAMLAQSLTQTSIIMGDHDAAQRFVDKALMNSAGGAGTFGAVLAESAEGQMDLMKGHLKQAIVRLRHAMDTFTHSGKEDRRGVSLSAIHLAEALYESDQTDEAIKLLHNYAPLVQDVGPADALISAHVIQARLMWEPNPDRALELLVELEERGHELQLPRVVASARLQRSIFRLASEDIINAEEQLELAEKNFDWPDLKQRWYLANDTLTPDIVRMRLSLRTGKAKMALPKLRDALKEAERTQHNRRSLTLRLLLAEAYHLDNQHNLARRTLAHALQVVEKEGFVRVLREEGPVLSSLVRDLQGHGELNDAASNTSPSGHAAPKANVIHDPLTPKELQVLSLLSEGLSNIAMAERLFVSESTVRTHLRSINLKLNAGNRTEAVIIARGMGLV